MISNKLLLVEMTANMMTNHSGESQCYGYGIWLEKHNDINIPISKAVTQVLVLSHVASKTRVL